MFDIRVLLGFADAVAMPREALLPLVLGDTDAALSADGAASETGVDVDRRSFGGLAAGAALAAMLPEAAAPSRVTASHVKYLEASAESLWLQSGSVGGAALLRPALRHWQLARRMLKRSSYTDSVGRELLVSTGQLADVSAYFAFDAANLSLAQQLHTEALELAESAGDSVLLAWVLTHMAGIPIYRASRASTADTDWASRNAARQAQRLVNRAADEARYEPLPWLHEMIACRQALAASLIGNTAAFRSSIARAQRELDRASGAGEPIWLQGGLGESTIIEFHARGSANLGDGAQAEVLYHKLLDQGLAPRARAFTAAHLAGLQLAQSAERDAIATGQTVLALLEDGVKSTRTLNELRPVRAAAAESGDEEFCARFDAAERALAVA
ncbi:MAG: hypothetical protein JO345_07595 [Streptosporangiaceae bacterium]|nr:hypothetical protein [Streptosporangiaceae bacterium]